MPPTHTLIGHVLCFFFSREAGVLLQPNAEVRHHNTRGADVKKTGPKWEKQKKKKAEILPPFNLTLPSIFDNDAKPLREPY